MPTLRSEARSETSTIAIRGCSAAKTVAARELRANVFRASSTTTFGTCRSNEALNAEIAREFESFVRAVEPGALYIHHEDTGHYDRTQLRWSERCDRCKQKWPNPDFAAADGGAGAMAHGYANILRAVQRVKNVDSGYDAARDCTTVFISPPYGIDSGRSGMAANRSTKI